MNVESMNVTREQAATAVAEYKAHRSVYDKKDWQVERIYRAIAKWQPSKLIARLPRIPPQHRPPSKSFSRYHVLWEADWEDYPRDPLLLRRIARDAWIVLAAWDLTDVEISVLRST